MTMQQVESYTQKLAQERGGDIRFIRAYEDGVLCWFYLRLDLEKLSEYEQALKTKEMNIRDYGTIIESDWGDYPPPDIVSFMQESYGFDTPSISA